MEELRRWGGWFSPFTHGIVALFLLWVLGVSLDTAAWVGVSFGLLTMAILVVAQLALNNSPFNNHRAHNAMIVSPWVAMALLSRGSSRPLR